MKLILILFLILIIIFVIFYGNIEQLTNSCPSGCTSNEDNISNNTSNNIDSELCIRCNIPRRSDLRRPNLEDNDFTFQPPSVCRMKYLRNII